MSFDVFVQCFHNGEPAGVPLASVKALFPVVESKSDSEMWFVDYGGSN